MGNGLLEFIYVRNLLFTKGEDLTNLAEYCLLSPLSLLVTSAANPFKYVPVLSVHPKNPTFPLPPMGLSKIHRLVGCSG